MNFKYQRRFSCVKYLKNITLKKAQSLIDNDDDDDTMIKRMKFSRNFRY